jgi:hypothetical protein
MSWAYMTARCTYPTGLVSQRAIQRLPHAIVYSNEDLGNPYQFVAYYENGQMIERGTTP